MKSNIKIHECLGLNFVTGLVSIEDIHMTPDFWDSGWRKNFTQRCEMPERQYKSRLDDARDVFRESRVLDRIADLKGEDIDPEVQSVLEHSLRKNSNY